FRPGRGQLPLPVVVGFGGGVVLQLEIRVRHNAVGGLLQFFIQFLLALQQLIGNVDGLLITIQAEQIAGGVGQYRRRAFIAVVGGGKAQHAGHGLFLSGGFFGRFFLQFGDPLLPGKDGGVTGAVVEFGVLILVADLLIIGGGGAELAGFKLCFGFQEALLGAVAAVRETASIQRVITGGILIRLAGFFLQIAVALVGAEFGLLLRLSVIVRGQFTQVGLQTGTECLLLRRVSLLPVARADAIGLYIILLGQ